MYVWCLRVFWQCHASMLFSNTTHCSLHLLHARLCYPWSDCGCGFHICAREGSTHRHTTHAHHLLIQQVLCKHGGHAPAVWAGVVKVNASFDKDIAASLLTTVQTGAATASVVRFCQPKSHFSIILQHISFEFNPSCRFWRQIIRNRCYFGDRSLEILPILSVLAIYHQWKSRF